MTKADASDREKGESLQDKRNEDDSGDEGRDDGDDDDDFDDNDVSLIVMDLRWDM